MSAKLLMWAVHLAAVATGLWLGTLIFDHFS